MHTKQELSEIAIVAAREAGAAVMELYGSRTFETKDDGSPVTVADNKANDILISALSKTGIDILTEESEGITTPYPDQLWIIDPIDGTSGFIKGTGDFAIMIGLLEKGRPTIGVLYAPSQDVLHVGIQGEGAFIERTNERREPLSLPPLGEPLRMVHSRHHYLPYFEEVSKELAAASVPRGGIGIKVSVLTDGDADCFFSWGNLGEWDVCGPQAVYEAMGGIVTDCYGDPLTYGEDDHVIKKGALFAHPDCHKIASKVIVQHKP